MYYLKIEFMRINIDDDVVLIEIINCINDVFVLLGYKVLRVTCLN